MSDISALKDSFKGDIVTPGDADYKAAIARWAVNAERDARVVAFVKDTDDVALALKYARSNNLQVAIRCGGHSPGGSSSAQDGLVVDLSRYFNYAVVDPDKYTVRVGGGSIWETVERESIKHGLATVGGTVNHTGVAGLLLGGGYGFLTGQHGTVVDNLLQATVVTADGTTLTASDSENSDLFWGIRGGGSNFGVCTEFILRLHPQRRTVFAGIVAFPPDAMDPLITVLSQWWANVKDNEGLSLVLGKDPLGRDAIILSLFYNGSEEEGRENFKAFYDLKPVFDGAREMPFEALNAISNQVFAHGDSYYLKSILYSRPRTEVMKQLFERVRELNAAPGNEIEHISYFDFFSHRKVVSVPVDATAHLRSSAGLIGCALKWRNNTPANEQAARLAARELTNIVTASDTQLSDAGKAGYGNFSSEAQPESVVTPTGHRVLDDSNSRALFGSNYPRLQRLKARYDPEIMFSRWYPVIPNSEA